MLSILGFLVTVAVLVVIHEWGHYRAAVACGVKVLRFSVGFGRVLFSRRFGPDRCEFTVCALPLGGYVRMLDEREGPVAAPDLHRAFNRQSLWRRAVIVAAGPAANLLLAVLLFSSLRWYGVDEPRALLAEPPAGSAAASAGLRAGDWVQAWSHGQGSWQDVRSMPDLRWALLRAAVEQRPLRLLVTDRDGRRPRVAEIPRGALGSGEWDAAALQSAGLGHVYSEPVVGEVRASGPAAEAGVLAGDLVLRVDGQLVPDAAALRERIRSSPGRSMTWEVERSGRVVMLNVKPRPHRDAAMREPIGRVDAVVGKPPASVRVSDDALAGLSWGLNRSWDLSVLTVQTIGRMLIGEASLRNLTGPLTIADAAGQSVSRGVAAFVAFLALVSVSLGVLNLLPLPMLDGGHLMYYFYEGIAGRPVPDVWLDRLQRGGFAVLLLMMSVALFNDVARLMGLH